MKGPGGQFMLDFPMGIPTVVLPSEERWAAVAPAWAKDLWPALRSELEAWCKANNTALELDARASVY